MLGEDPDVGAMKEMPIPYPSWRWYPGLVGGGFDDASNYAGPDLYDEYVLYIRSRDSEALINANYDAIWDEVKNLPGVSDGRVGHWACGWIDQIMIHKDSCQAMFKAFRFREILDNDGIIDEDLFMEYEQQEHFDAGEMECPECNDWINAEVGEKCYCGRVLRARDIKKHEKVVAAWEKQQEEMEKQKKDAAARDQFKNFVTLIGGKDEAKKIFGDDVKDNPFDENIGPVDLWKKFLWATFKDWRKIDLQGYPAKGAPWKRMRNERYTFMSSALAKWLRVHSFGARTELIFNAKHLADLISDFDPQLGKDHYPQMSKACGEYLEWFMVQDFKQRKIDAHNLCLEWWKGTDQKVLIDWLIDFLAPKDNAFSPKPDKIIIKQIRDNFKDKDNHLEVINMLIYAEDWFGAYADIQTSLKEKRDSKWMTSKSFEEALKAKIKANPGPWDYTSQPPVDAAQKLMAAVRVPVYHKMGELVEFRVLRPGMDLLADDILLKRVGTKDTLLTVRLGSEGLPAGSAASTYIRARVINRATLYPPFLYYWFQGFRTTLVQRFQRRAVQQFVNVTDLKDIILEMK